MEIISHCARLYHRFPLSLREVEEMMLERGVIVSYETVLVTDKLASYRVAHRRLMAGVEHHRSKYLNKEVPPRSWRHGL